METPKQHKTLTIVKIKIKKLHRFMVKFADFKQEQVSITHTQHLNETVVYSVEFKMVTKKKVATNLLYHHKIPA